MADPLISVVVTNYNYGKYLSEAVQSIVDQSYEPIELIVVDDGSADDSQKIIARLKSLHQDRFQRFIVRFLEANKGVNAALNVAMQDVEGEITVIFDADDILDKNHLQKMVSVLLGAHKNDEAITFSYCDCILIDELGSKIQRGLSKAFKPELIETESFLPRPSPIFSSTLKSFFPLPEDSTDDPKHSLWKEICRAGYKGVYVQEPLFLYRVHSSNISHIGDKVRAAQKSGLAEQPLYLSDYWPSS